MDEADKKAEELLPCYCQGLPHRYDCPAYVRPAVAAALREKDIEIQHLQRGYQAKGIEAWPCPGCKYENGKFIEHCELHAEIERYKTAQASPLALRLLVEGKWRTVIANLKKS